MEKIPTNDRVWLGLGWFGLARPPICFARFLAEAEKVVVLRGGFGMFVCV